MITSKILIADGDEPITQHLIIRILQEFPKAHITCIIKNVKLQPEIPVKQLTYVEKIDDYDLQKLCKVVSVIFIFYQKRMSTKFQRILDSAMLYKPKKVIYLTPIEYISNNNPFLNYKIDSNIEIINKYKNNLNILILYIPYFSIYYSDFTQSIDHLFASVISFGILPNISFCPLHDINILANIITNVSFSSENNKNVIHIFNPTKINLSNFVKEAFDYGLNIKRVSWIDFRNKLIKYKYDNNFVKFCEFLILKDEELFYHNMGKNYKAEWPKFQEIWKRRLILGCKQDHIYKLGNTLISLTFENIFARAIVICGLDDLDDINDMLVESYTNLFNSFYNGGKLSFTCHMSAVRTYTQYLINILTMIKKEKENPRILEEHIVAPIFIVGLNRTGTSFLQQLLSVDGSNRSPMLCELLLPFSEDSVELCSDMNYQLFGADDNLEKMHKRVALMAEEEIDIFHAIGRSYSLIFGFEMDEYKNWLNTHENHQIMYKFHKRFLKHLQYKTKSRQWILKSPFHLLSIKELIDEYPDCKFIITHRNIYEIIVSWFILQNATRKLMNQTYDLNKLVLDGFEILQNMLIGLEQLKLSDKRIMEIEFLYLVSNPISCVKSIYKFFNWKMTSDVAANMWQHLISLGKTSKEFLNIFDPTFLKKCKYKEETDVVVVLKNEHQKLEILVKHVNYYLQPKTTQKSVQKNFRMFSFLTFLKYLITKKNLTEKNNKNKS